MIFYINFNEQIPGSQEVANSPVDRIPKTKDGLIDWSQVSWTCLFSLLCSKGDLSIVCPSLLSSFCQKNQSQLQKRFHKEQSSIFLAIWKLFDSGKPLC